MLRILHHPREIRQELHRLKTLPPTPDWTLLNPVIETLQRVQRQGEAAWIGELDSAFWCIRGSQIDAAYQRIAQATLTTIRQASYELSQLYRRQLPRPQVSFGQEEQVQGQRFYPVQRAGFYLASPTRSHLGQLLQQGLLAKAVGVPERVLIIDGESGADIAPELLVAAQEMGIQEIYRLPGVMAIAALAFGTETLSPVEAITGVGPAAVMWAKQLVSGWVNIDRSLGQSSWMLLAESAASPQLIALDILTQAEQNPQSSLVILVDSLPLAEAINQWVSQYCREQEQSVHTEKAIAHYGVIGVVNDPQTWPSWVDQFSPQTLVLALSDPWNVVEKVKRAATIFLGQRTIPLAGELHCPHPTLCYPYGSFRSLTRLSLQCFLRASQIYDHGNLPYLQWLNEVVLYQEMAAINSRMDLS